MGPRPLLPSRRAALSAALQAFDRPHRPEIEREIRVTLLDGSTKAGILREHSEAHLAFELRSGDLAYVPVEEISLLEVGVRRAGREFVVVGGMIVGITALLVLEWSIPFLREHLRLSWLAGQLAIFGFAGIGVMRKRTRLGDWLRAWKPVYDVERPVG